MILYCIITYLMTLGFIVGGESPREYKFIMLVHALTGPIVMPIILGAFIVEVADYMREQKRKTK